MLLSGHGLAALPGQGVLARLRFTNAGADVPFDEVLAGKRVLLPAHRVDSGEAAELGCYCNADGEGVRRRERDVVAVVCPVGDRVGCFGRKGETTASR